MLKGVWATFLRIGLVLAGLILVGCAARLTPSGADSGRPAAGVAPSAPGGQQAAAQAPREPAQIRRLQNGPIGVEVQQGAYVAQSPEAWQALWLRLFGNEQQPTVDFNHEVALVLAMGEQRTAGYQIRAASGAWEGRTLHLQVEQKRPAPGTMVAQVITHPYEIVVVALPRGVSANDVEVVTRW